MSIYGTNCREKVHVVPYSVNIMATDALRFPDYYWLVKDYIVWYLQHTNDADKFNLTGTIYDLNVTKDGVETWTRKYDSADAYAGTFLLLMWKYYNATGDSNLADKYRKRLEDMAYMITVLQDEDGLTYAWRGYDAKYLMDNCEAYAGLLAYSKLRHELWGVKNKTYASAAEGIKEGVLTFLFDARNLMFYWGLGKDGAAYESDWDNFYPDALAQIYPIDFGLIEPDSPLAVHIWQTFSGYFNAWDTQSVDQRLIYDNVFRIMEGGG